MKGNKGLRHRGSSKAKGGLFKLGGSTGGPEGNKNVLRQAAEGNKGGGHIGGGSGPAMGRRRGGDSGADKHPFSSARKSGGKCGS
jgi:hypothetical protein